MYLRALKLFLLGAVVVSIIGCSATPTRRSFKEGWKDSVVSTKVKMKLTKDKLVKKRNIDVDAWRGVITMTGRVTSEEEKERAEQLAWQIKGVRGVDNFLKLVYDASAEPIEVVAGKDSKETNVKNVVTIEEEITDKKKVTEKAVAKRGMATHPVKSDFESKVSNRVEGPVVYEETATATEKISRRKSYNKPEISNIKEEDLTVEQSLAKDAADELRQLRDEDDFSE